MLILVWVVNHYSLSWALLLFSILNYISKQVTQISPCGMLPTSTARDSPGIRVKQLSARFIGRQFSLTLRYIHTQLAIFLVLIVRELPWKEQVSPGSALLLFFMATKKQLLELTTLSRVRRSILMKALWVKLAYSVLLKRWTSARSKGLTVFSTVCLILVAYPAKVMMASWQWQLKVLLQSFTIYVTQSPVTLSWMVWIISCSYELLTLQCAALQVPKQSTVAHEVTGQTSFSCQQRLPMLQGLLRRRVVIAISRAYDCITCEKYEMRVVFPVAQEQLNVYPGRSMCPLG